MTAQPNGILASNLPGIAIGDYEVTKTPPEKAIIITTQGSGALQVPVADGLGGYGWGAGSVSPAEALLGSTANSVIPPWTPPPLFGMEMFILSNLYGGAGGQTTTLTPSITPNGTTQTVKSMVQLGNTQNADQSYRVRLDFLSLPTPAQGGWWKVSLALTDYTGTIISGTQEQLLVSEGVLNTSTAYLFEFEIIAGAAAQTALLVTMEVVGNVAVGNALTVQLTSLQQVAAVSRPVFFMNTVSGTAGPAVYQRLFDPVAKTWRMAQTLLNADNALANSLGFVNGYSTDNPFGVALPDPAFLLTTQAISSSIGLGSIPSTVPRGGFMRILRVNNNDQIIQVQDSSGNWELRGNTHGGESLQAGYPIFQYDLGDDIWHVWTPATNDITLYTARRFQFLWNTNIVRTTPGDTIAQTTHACTFFPDGVMRCDRTTTWLEQINVGNLFEWLSSHDLGTPKIGRIGAGLRVISNADIFPKLASPSAPTLATASGGHLAAATYIYGQTAIGEGGETTLGATASIVTSASGQNTITLATVAGALGYGIYRGTVVGNMIKIGTVGPTATTFLDDGTEAVLSGSPPNVNLARTLDAGSVVEDNAVSQAATWAVWYDPILNMCFGNIYDRDSVASRPASPTTEMRLEAGSGIVKNYLNLLWPAGTFSSPASTGPGVNIRAVPQGEVWTATHWCFAYCPADPVNYHLEIAARATDLGVLKTLYPAT